MNGVVKALGGTFSPSPVGPGVMAAEESMRGWYVRGLAFMVVGYVVASQGLTFVSGWSRLGFVFAVLLAILLAMGRILGMFRIRSGGWIWLALVFVAYCIFRGVPEARHEWPSGVLLQLCSVFLGGIGVGLALQAGVPFRALAYAQTAVFVGNIVAGLFGIGTEPPAEVEAGRRAGLTGNANELAMQLTLGACLVWLFPKKSGAVACSLAVAAVGYAVLTTGSRKSLLVLAFFLILIGVQVALVLKRRSLRLALLLVAPALLAGVVLAPVVLERARNVIAVRRALDLEDHSATLRFEMAHQALRLWTQSPVVGWGTDAFSRISGFGMYAHSNLVELLCDLGVVGWLLFYAMHGYILWKCRSQPRPLRWYCAVFVLMLIALDVGSVTYNRKQTIMILMVLAAVSANAGSFVRRSPIRQTGVQQVLFRQPVFAARAAIRGSRGVSGPAGGGMKMVGQRDMRKAVGKS